MKKDFVISVEVQEFSGFKLRGFRYGEAFLTKSGCEHLIQQSEKRGEKPDPVLVAGLEAINSENSGKNIGPETVEAWMKRLKKPFNEGDIKGQATDFTFANHGARAIGTVGKRSEELRPEKVDVFRVTI